MIFVIYSKRNQVRRREEEVEEEGNEEDLSGRDR